MSARLTAAALFLAVGLGGCMSVLAPASFGDGEPQMRPEAFFAGATSSSGVLETRSGAPTRRLHVQGSGRLLADGAFRLEQSVTLDHDAPTMRTWILRRLDEHHYTSSLTDASGPVHGEAYGDLFHLRYPMKSPIIDARKPQAALDRLHTYCMKKFAHLLRANCLEVHDNDPLNGRVGRLFNPLRKAGKVSPMSDKIMKGSVEAFEAFNKVRNDASFAHDNEILSPAEAHFIFDGVVNLLRFVRALEAEHFGA